MKPVLVVQNWSAESPGNISEYLKENNIPCQVVQTFDNQPLPSVGDCSALIVLGYPKTVNEYLKYDGHKELFALIAEAVRIDHPLLAICYGAQMLAKVLGSQVKENHVKEIGACPVRLTDEGRKDKLFSGIETEFDVFQWHSDTFRLPFGATHLASSDSCAMQAFRCRNQVGIQFHIEPTTDELPLWCDEYIDELSNFGKTKSEIVTEFNQKAESIKATSFRLLQNFLMD